MEQTVNEPTWFKVLGNVLCLVVLILVLAFMMAIVCIPTWIAISIAGHSGLSTLGWTVAIIAQFAWVGLLGFTYTAQEPTFDKGLGGKE